MKSPSGLLLTCFVALVTLAAAAPLLIRLSHALVPLVIAVGVVAVGLRLVFFHTRRW
jgi:hypothetical protein